MSDQSLHRHDPPVVFIAQLGAPGRIWQPVLDRLNPDVAAVTYDRPGLGNKPPRPAPNPPIPHSVFADELAAELDQRGITQPAVIVGHSLGGNIARVYAARHPHRIAGLVFVDSSIPQTHLWPGLEPSIDGDGPDATTVDTVAGHVEILSGKLPHVPTVVLARQARWWYPTYENIPHPAVDDLWQVCQRLLAEQTDAPLIIAANSGHQMQRDATDLVVYAIHAVVRAVRTGTRPSIDPGEVATVGGRLVN